MQPLAFGSLYTWSVWQPDRNVFFNSHFAVRAGGNTAIDPLAWTEDDAAQMRARGGVSTIIVTNRDHERKARELAALFGATIAASERDGPLLTGPVDRVLHDGEAAFAGAVVVELEGLKSPGEIALHLPADRAAIVGDALWGDPAGSVRLLPDEKLLDARAAVLSLRRLWALNLNALLVGDGASIYADADRVIGEYLESRRDVYVNRINLDEAEWRHIDEGPFSCDDAEIGLLIGARKLGYRVSTLPPGTKFCPVHAHAREEEMFYVLDGAPTIRTPRGDVVCRRGDFIAFPTRDSGAHALVNESGAPCTVLLLANVDSDDVCYYPDSDKLMIGPRDDLIVRASPALDYFDGEH